jgi:hypothetical protein
MVKCDKCPCLYFLGNGYACSISGEFIAFDYEQQITENCQLVELKLKDGTVFEPEDV